MKYYPVTCKVGGAATPGYPCFFRRPEVEQALGQDDFFPRAAVVNIIDIGGIIYAYKNAGEARLTLGDRPQ